MGSLLCHYGEMNYAFLMGGLVQPCETLMAGAIRYYRHLDNFRLVQNDRLYLVKTIDSCKDHEPVKCVFFMIFFVDLSGGRVAKLPHWLWLLTII